MRKKWKIKLQMQGKLLIIFKVLPHMNELNITSATIQIKRSKGYF